LEAYAQKNRGLARAITSRQQGAGGDQAEINVIAIVDVLHCDREEEKERLHVKGLGLLLHLEQQSARCGVPNGVILVLQQDEAA
jgi:hypothetical protein